MAVELTPGRVDSAGDPSEVGKMSTSVVVTAASPANDATYSIVLYKKAEE